MLGIDPASKFEDEARDFFKLHILGEFSTYAGEAFRNRRAHEIDKLIRYFEDDMAKKKHGEGNPFKAESLNDVTMWVRCPLFIPGEDGFCSQTSEDCDRIKSETGHNMVGRLGVRGGCYYKMIGIDRVPQLSVEQLAHEMRVRDICSQCIVPADCLTCYMWCHFTPKVQGGK